MIPQDLIDIGVTTLDRCDEVLTKLHDLCCEPNRSPRMNGLAETLSDVRDALHDDGAAATDEIVALLEGAGAEIGRLQVTCCAPARMPLYAELLEGLSRTQRLLLTAQGGMEH